eukprot:TRINITY_DN1705_c0_g1_i5.p1 TRINITY_DN1705_c0_g1~~TRINITY_DN1705_c0_g1_i5.p1  ORF type:complete len:301 (-),score=127.21 TRINITY_DN1705_c0_g1_i5:164-1066(-)
MQLSVPGTYEANKEVIHIKGFGRILSVFNSKQKPRKLTIFGSDGYEYLFLLKGHEDLRQDERVMQLFGLVNSLLSTRGNRSVSQGLLIIQRYVVIPLSQNSGLAGWVGYCDTLHSLITLHHTLHKIEHKEIMETTPKGNDQSYEAMTLIQRVEAFEHSIANTQGDDLQKILWLKSANSEAWLARRTNFTKSLAVMSMVGYILGLGDRHPNNLLMQLHNGKVIHIDFGDCFEVAHRERYSEKIPFGFTRMLIKVIGASRIEGIFRITCEKVMRVLRNNNESVMAMLEAFVYDPLVNWGLAK